MIILVKKNCEIEKLDSLINRIERHGLKTDTFNCEDYVVLSVSGDLSKIDVEAVRANDIVLGIKRVTEPFYLASRKNKKRDTVVDVCGRKIGGGNFCFIAGPCAVESEKQIVETAIQLKKAGVQILRGGAFKPRTSPYSFQGLGVEGLKYLSQAKKETGLPVVSEITSVNQLDLFSDIDVLQIGARGMQNFELLKEVGKSNKPILLKRAISATIEEWLLSAEYLLSQGCKDVILCERGIRTHEPTSRATLDLSSIPVLKELTHLPVIVDPSHASGNARYVKSLSLAGVAVGADGVMIEVHPSPETALSDGAQAVTPSVFNDIYKDVTRILPIINKRID